MNNLEHPFLLLILVAYLSANGLCLLAYWPQLRSVIVDPIARSKIVPFTWWVWTLGGATECLYAIFGAHQLVWAGVALVHMGACATIASMGTWSRVQHKSTFGDAVPASFSPATFPASPKLPLSPASMNLDINLKRSSG